MAKEFKNERYEGVKGQFGKQNMKKGSSRSGVNPPMREMGREERGSTISGVNPKMKLPKVEKGTSVANDGLKNSLKYKTKEAPNQNLKTKAHPGNYGEVQDLETVREKIHKERGGKLMKQLFAGRI